MLRHTAETYREAAVEHVELARLLHEQWREYGAAHYWAGLAVECMLRAYQVRRDPVFEGRHDLAALADGARLYDVLPDEAAREAALAMQQVVLRWRNDHRFRPARLIRKWLRDQGLDRTVKGDRLKYSSGRIVAAASAVVRIGDEQWS